MPKPLRSLPRPVPAAALPGLVTLPLAAVGQARTHTCIPHRDWLESDDGLDRWEALQPLSRLGKARIGNLVYPDRGAVVTLFPKKHLPR